MGERKQREDVGESDGDAICQTVVMPEINKNLVGYPIEYCFIYNGKDGPYPVWCDGKIETIINAEKRLVEIKWKEKGIQERHKDIDTHAEN